LSDLASTIAFPTALITGALQTLDVADEKNAGLVGVYRASGFRFMPAAHGRTKES
jgi:hypothetical protein